MNKTEIDKILFMDIETVPIDYRYADMGEERRKLWDGKWRHRSDITPEQQYEKAGIYAEFAKVVCIGAGYYDNGRFNIETITGHDETDVLNRFSLLLANRFNTFGHVLCAHNGREFDFPFLCRRFLINGLPMPRILQIQGLKPWEIRHIDTMDLWKFGDVKSFSSLSLLAHVFNIPSPKDEMDGSMVASAYYEQNDLEKIARYCRKDVLTLARVYSRFAGVPQPADEDVIFA